MNVEMNFLLELPFIKAKYSEEDEDEEIKI